MSLKEWHLPAGFHGANPIEIFQRLTELLRFEVFAHLHLINIQEEPIVNNVKNVLKF